MKQSDYCKECFLTRADMGGVSVQSTQQRIGNIWHADFQVLTGRHLEPVVQISHVYQSLNDFLVGLGI